MNKDKMVKVRLLNGSDYPLPTNIFPLEVECQLADDRGVLVHFSKFMEIDPDTTLNEGWVFFNKSEYELITEEDPDLLFPQQQSIEQLLVTRNDCKKTIQSINDEITNRLGKLGYRLIDD